MLTTICSSPAPLWQAVIASPRSAAASKRPTVTIRPPPLNPYQLPTSNGLGCGLRKYQSRLRIIQACQRLSTPRDHICKMIDFGGIGRAIPCQEEVFEPVG